MPNADCPFCAVADRDILVAEPLAFARRDFFPVSKGHTLIIPRRHIASFFDTTQEERQAMLRLLDGARALLDREHQPGGYNIGINNGAAAGQTVMHVHMHLIPRYASDTGDARGGVRWVLPERAAYWKK